MFQLSQIGTVPTGGNYGPVYDAIGPHPMSRDQKQKIAF